MRSKIYNQELEKISAIDWIDWDQLRNKTIFVTGATGLIGEMLVKSLLFSNEKYNLGLTIVILVRDEKKAKYIFSKCSSKSLLYCVGTVESFTIPNDVSIDYIVHAANPTSSKYFVEHPVETINTAVLGTKRVLDLCKIHPVESLVYLSSMEVYGHPQKGEYVTEEMVGSFDTMNVRNAYPLSKKMSENLCMAYASEYSAPVKIARLTQTFGPGVQYEDNRVFAQFARCAIEEKDIILKTKGLTERCYLYIADAITAILTILLKGENKQVYSVANEATYCSIFDMAHLVAKQFDVCVKIEEEDIAKYGYANTLYMNLCTKKIKQLGWVPTTDLLDMYKKMIMEMKICR